jgi:methylmalonyl-CoA mutase N-terminal domain/subunit
VANTIDPLAGSYFIETLTDELERDALEIFEEVDALGGVVPGIEQGWFQQRIASSAMRQQREVESGERVVVGVNHFREGSEKIEIDTLKIDPEVERRQVAAMAELRATRDGDTVRASLTALAAACASGDNVVPRILDCARAYCTLYEIREAMEGVFGSYKEPVFF